MGDEQWHVVERVPTRSGGADFGVPTTVLASDHGDLGTDEASRTAALLAASWEVLDEVAAGHPQALRKGARGGGRDRDAITQHVAAGRAAVRPEGRCQATRPSPWRPRGHHGQQGGDPGMVPVGWKTRPRFGRAGHRATRRGGSSGMSWTMPGRSRTGVHDLPAPCLRSEPTVRRSEPTALRSEPTLCGN